MRKKSEIDQAESLSNGIIFHSKRHKGYVAIATIDEKNVITTKWTTQKEYEKNKSRKQKIKEIKDFLISVLYDLPIIILVYYLVNYVFPQISILRMRFLFLGFFLATLWSFITTVLTTKNTGAYNFHSAEHMVINAYQDLERIPSLEELYQYSRFCNSCGTNFHAIVILSFASMFICTFIPNSLYQIIITLTLILIIFCLSKLGYLNFLQNFTTIPATDKELNVAIEGLKEWLKNEEKEEE